MICWPEEVNRKRWGRQLSRFSRKWKLNDATRRLTGLRELRRLLRFPSSLGLEVVKERLVECRETVISSSRKRRGGEKGRKDSR